MDPNRLMLAQDEFNAHVLRGVMAATDQPGETAQDAQMRCAVIVELFRTFEAANPMEAMIACHCISLRFMLDAAMRDANTGDHEPALLIRLRASAMAIGKSLHLWTADYASLHARNEARAAEEPRYASQKEAAARPSNLQNQATQPSPRRSEQPVARATKPPPIVAPMASPAPPLSGGPALELPNLPAHSMKQGLLSSAAMTLAAAANGRFRPAGDPAPSCAG